MMISAATVGLCALFLAADAPLVAAEATRLGGTNEALEGRTARIELVSGEVVAGATHVVMGTDTTSYRKRGSKGAEATEEQLPTASIRTVTASGTSFWRSLGWGLGGGAVAGGGLVVSAGDRGGFGGIGPSGGEVVAGATVLGGAIGALVGAIRHSPAEIVYQGPIDDGTVAATPTEEDAATRAFEARLTAMVRPDR